MFKGGMQLIKTPERNNMSFSDRILLKILIFLHYIFTKMRPENDLLFLSGVFTLKKMPEDRESLIGVHFRCNFLNSRKYLRRSCKEILKIFTNFSLCSSSAFFRATFLSSSITLLSLSNLSACKSGVTSADLVFSIFLTIS